jgi:hypothetical protein
MASELNDLVVTIFLGVMSLLIVWGIHALPDRPVIHVDPPGPKFVEVAPDKHPPRQVVVATRK